MAIIINSYCKTLVLEVNNNIKMDHMQGEHVPGIKRELSPAYAIFR